MNQSLSLTQRTLFILTNPSHPGNVGSAARALKTMRFAQLCLVKPRFDNVISNEQAIALASGAQDVLQSTLIMPTLQQALAPITLSFALTARTRDMGPQVVDIRQAALLANNHLRQDPHRQVAIVLGTERSGLSNEQISHCHYICHIPANPQYSSLNVAQALQLAAWELSYTFFQHHQQHIPSTYVTDNQSQSMPKQINSTFVNQDEQCHIENSDPLAPQKKVDDLLVHWQEALQAIAFLNPLHPKKLMLRMHYWFMRSHLTQDEVDMMHGVCTQILKQVNNGKPKQGVATSSPNAGKHF